MIPPPTATGTIAMPARLLDGKTIAAEIRERVQKQVKERLDGGVRVPASRSCSWARIRPLAGLCPQQAQCLRGRGLSFRASHPAADTSESALLALIDELNAREEIDGILVQLPLPPQIDAEKVTERILPTKDVDGFHPYNIGRLALRLPLLRPCTPRGVMTMLYRAGVQLEGLDAVIIASRTSLAGRWRWSCWPRAARSRSATAARGPCRQGARCRLAGRGDRQARFVPGDWVKPARWDRRGINRLPDGSLCGDVDFEAARRMRRGSPPVPGGVGP